MKTNLNRAAKTIHEKILNIRSSNHSHFKESIDSAANPSETILSKSR